eukprot:NODE_1671_length_799_cov_42.014667_g1299_i0.p2 GENE.NODE_1671_length_799_cov_42.014667_g1299_i0~~NODE_1671_length_799_cov_42.014667_g1299_i0.p2  ORF type:complete len:71 (+),score=1.51 NODE_1671_length_799_cov_42.014667_g1299_i0:522-734(+)
MENTQLKVKAEAEEMAIAEEIVIAEETMTEMTDLEVATTIDVAKGLALVIDPVNVDVRVLVRQDKPPQKS